MPYRATASPAVRAGPMPPASGHTLRNRSDAEPLGADHAIGARPLPDPDRDRRNPTSPRNFS